jgi:drug/metabolite transporter (DMT)-like permease
MRGDLISPALFILSGLCMKNPSQTKVALEAASSVKISDSLLERAGIIFSLFALYIIWGSTYLVTHIALAAGLPPFLMSGIRFVIAGAILYGYLRARHETHPTRAQWIGAGLVGLLLIVGGNGGTTFAVQWVASGLTAVGVGAMPLWAALFIGIMLGRWPNRLEWTGLLLGFGGIILLNLGNNLWVSPQGAIALLVGPICWALGSALSSRVTLPKGLMASAVQMLVGGVLMIGIGLTIGERITHVPSANALGAFIYLVTFGSLIAYCAYGYLLRKVRPALATSYAYVNPAVALLLGSWFGSEPLTLVGIAAMLVILTGVGLVSLGKTRNV